MPVIKNGELASDPYRQLADDEPLGEGPVLVSLTRLIAEADALTARKQPFGVIVRVGVKMPQDEKSGAAGGEDVEALAPYLARLSVVAIEFPTFRNGRGYSSARILREHMGYKGELRAVGEVLRDQWQFMARCGFDAFELPEGADPQAFGPALKELSRAYQPDALTPTSIMHMRHGK